MKTWRKPYRNYAIKATPDASIRQTGIPKWLGRLEKICNQACTELEEEFNLIKNANE